MSRLNKQLGAMVVHALQQDWDVVEQIAKDIQVAIDPDGEPIIKALAMQEALRTPRPEADTYSPTWEEVDGLCRGRSNIDLAEMVLKLKRQLPQVGEP